VVPANLTVYDIAGLTRGASTGAGLGNAFLSHIRAVDAIFQVVRCFDDAEIIHVEGDVDPVRDLDIISEELRIKDLEFAEKSLDAQIKLTKRGGQSLEVKRAKEDQATVLVWMSQGYQIPRVGMDATKVKSPRFYAGEDGFHVVARSKWLVKLPHRSVGSYPAVVLSATWPQFRSPRT